MRVSASAACPAPGAGKAGREQPGEQPLKESMEVKHTDWEGKRPLCSNEQLPWEAGAAELLLSPTGPDTAV